MAVSRAVVVPVLEYPWLGREATGQAGRTGTVRRVFDVGGLLFAILTCDEPESEAWRIWDEPVAVLAAEGLPCAFPDRDARTEELCDVEDRIQSGRAGAADPERHAELLRLLTPYNRGAADLHTALIAGLRRGDRIAYGDQGLYGEVVDADVDEDRFMLRIRLDARHLQERPRLRERYPDGVVLLPSIVLQPTLGLL
ncbi:hypothetical protein [Kitasatospora sp. NPDC088783]|uniref:hypothetical protein n=1 Tax=Kitasatospora sp. NPDC088783 TaxID=3364077 RepID=UPI003807490B